MTSVKQYIKDAIGNVSSIIFGSSDKDPEVECSPEVECTLIDSLSDWSKDNECNETVVLKKSDYEKICSELSLARLQANNSRIKEKEYKKDLIEMNNTLSYLINKNEEGNNNTIVLGPSKVNNNFCLENDLNRLRSAEQRLKAHIKALQRDLFDAESKAESFKEMVFEEINKHKEEINKLKEEIKELKNQNEKNLNLKERAEGTVEKRSEECVELIEYIKILMDKK
jgi:chromosome segregation ATPase